MQYVKLDMDQKFIFVCSVTKQRQTRADLIGTNCNVFKGQFFKSDQLPINGSPWIFLGDLLGYYRNLIMTFLLNKENFKVFWQML